MSIAVTETGSRNFGDAFRLLGRVLTFRATHTELLALNSYDLTLGLLFTWIVGIGRYWDNPRVELLQHFGIGSVVYVFVLATFLFLILWPLRPNRWNWKNLLIFITLTSPPGLLYAIPVQMIFPKPGLETANEINLLFLAIVSIWRVSLLVYYLIRVGKFDFWGGIVAVMFPIDIIIVVLTILNLDRVVFRIMGGLDESNVSPNDDIYMVLMTITLLSIWLGIFLLIAYILAILERNGVFSKAKKTGENPTPKA